MSFEKKGKEVIFRRRFFVKIKNPIPVREGSGASAGMVERCRSNHELAEPGSVRRKFSNWFETAHLFQADREMERRHLGSERTL